MIKNGVTAVLRCSGATVGIQRRFAGLQCCGAAVILRRGFRECLHGFQNRSTPNRSPVARRKLQPLPNGSTPNCSTVARCKPQHRSTAARGFILLLSLTPFAHASTGGEFLKLGGSARAVAMGDAFTAMAGTVETLEYNPAGLSSLARPELSVTHTEYFADTRYDVLSFGAPSPVGSWGARAVRLGGGSFDGRDAFRNPTGDFTAEDFSAGLSYARTIGSHLAFGLTGKWINSRIASLEARSVGGDAGLLARVPGYPLLLGLALTHVGQGLRFIDERDPLPLTVALGAALQPIDRFLVTLDAQEQPRDHIAKIGVGLEYFVLKALALRAGYQGRLDHSFDNELGGTSTLRGGLGLRWGNTSADYTLAPFGDLGLTHRFTLSLRFGKNAAPPNDVLLLKQ